MTDHDDAAKRVMEALQQYREADTAMHARARSASSMSDNEIRIIQFLLAASRNDRKVTPTALSKHLGVTSASMTALLDRLERAGAIERVPHPSDRRSLLITATPLAESTVGAPVLAFEEATRQIAADLTDAEHAAVVSFLENLTGAVDRASRAVVA